MKRWNYLGPLLAALSLCNTRALSAALPAVPVASGNNHVTLDALVAEALEKNPELRFYEAEMAAAKAGRKTAKL